MEDTENLDSKEAVEDAEPVEAVEDAEPEEAVDSLEDAELLEEEAQEEIPASSIEPEDQLKELEQIAYIRMMEEKYRYGPIPVLITNKSLVILWHNQALCRLFGAEPSCRDAPRWQGEYLTRMFAPTTGETGSMDLFKRLRSAEYGHSWQGHIEGEREEKRKLLAHLMMMPLFGSPDIEEPQAYMGLLSDLSLYHHQMMRNTFSSLLEASKMKDNDTGNHIQRVNEYAQMMAQNLFGHPEYGDIDIDFLEDIGFLAAMHDVGKIGTPDDILNKTDKLNDWEWDIMREHTINGAYILSTYPNPMARDIALFHHERWNGSGYPYGLKGDAIPLAARIVALADVYDALRMKRSYKPPFSHEKSVTIIQEEAGSHFDPRLTKWFLELQDQFQEIFQNLQD